MMPEQERLLRSLNVKSPLRVLGYSPHPCRHRSHLHGSRLVMRYADITGTALSFIPHLFHARLVCAVASQLTEDIFQMN